MVQYVAFGQQVNKDKSKERKQSLLNFYALLKPPICWAKENSLQTEPWAGVLVMAQPGKLRQQESSKWEETGKVNRHWGDSPSTKHPLQPPRVHRMPPCSGTQTVEVLLLITLTTRKHSLVMNSLIHPLLAFPVHPLLGQQQKYFAWKLLIPENHLKGAPPLFLHCTLARGDYSRQGISFPTHVLQKTALSSSGVIS